MTPIPTVWWLRPVRSAARVGAQSAVVWKRLYLRPCPARRSAVGVAHGPPNALEAAKPTSSSRMTRTFGAPTGGRSGSMGGNFASGSFASKGTSPSYGRSGIGRTSLCVWDLLNSHHLSARRTKDGTPELDSPTAHPARGDGRGHHRGFRNRRGAGCDSLGHYGGFRHRVADDANSSDACWSEWHFSLLRSQVLHRPRWMR